MKVKFTLGVTKPWLTPNKEYDVIPEEEALAFSIIDDVGDEIYCLFEDCVYLNGGDWEIVEDD
jgi:hypothetical protein|tara:strand:+ start:520 stop:708 length:189 start_codon:yes stop_codon:yes gene_type:complete